MNDSYVKVSAKLALDRAELNLVAIRHRRNKEWESRILQEQARRGRARFWMPWLKPLTEPMARERIMLESMSVYGRYSPGLIDWERESRCKRIVQLAQTAAEDCEENLTPAYVYLSSEDLEHISL